MFHPQSFLIYDYLYIHSLVTFTAQRETSEGPKVEFLTVSCCFLFCTHVVPLTVDSCSLIKKRKSQYFESLVKYCSLKGVSLLHIIFLKVSEEWISTSRCKDGA